MKVSWLHPNLQFIFLMSAEVNLGVGNGNVLNEAAHAPPGVKRRSHETSLLVQCSFFLAEFPDQLAGSNV